MYVSGIMPAKMASPLPVPLPLLGLPVITVISRIMREFVKTCEWWASGSVLNCRMKSGKILSVISLHMIVEYLMTATFLLFYSFISFIIFFIKFVILSNNISSTSSISGNIAKYKIFSYSIVLNFSFIAI